MRIAVVGIGAMGCLFASRLSRVADVSMLGHWRPQVDTLRTHGLTLIEPDGRQQVVRIFVATDPEKIGTADVALVLVKSYQSTRAGIEVARLLTHRGLAVTLQNGLENLEAVAAHVGSERAALGATTEGATLLRPGVVRHAGRGTTHLARGTIGQAATIARLATLFNQVGLGTELTDDVDSVVWGKLAINAAINPLTALLHVNNGYLPRHQATRLLMTMAAEEVSAIAKAKGIRLMLANVGDKVQEVAVATAENHSSMLQDVKNGRRTEIDAICGAIVRAGRQLGIDTPINAALLRLVKEAGEGREWRESFESLPSDLANLFSRASEEMEG